MLHKTRGIVFRFTKYGDSSIIVTIFTELFGLQTYIVNGVRSKAAKGKIALYQPLTLLDLVVYYKENASIKRIKEVRCVHQYQSLQMDIRKASIGMFLNEILNKTVKEESYSPELFDFIFSSLIFLDDQKEGYENFHLIFLIKLSRFLGFGAHHINEVLNGRLTDGEDEEALKKLINSNFDDTQSVTNLQRRTILEILIRFFTTHMELIGEIRSVQVLKDVLTTDFSD